MKTSHDMLREAVSKHGMLPTEIVDKIVADTGRDREFVQDHVDRFLAGGHATWAVATAVILLSIPKPTVH